MAIHVQDEETEALVRDFANRRGVGTTEAIKIAITEASEHGGVPPAVTPRARQSLEDLKRELEPIWIEIRARRVGIYSVEEDKEFMDDMWGENDR